MVPIARRRCHRRAGDRREQRAGDDRDQPQRTPDAAEPGGGKIDQRFRHAAMAHEGVAAMTNNGSDIRVGELSVIDDDLRHADQRFAGGEVEHRCAKPQHEEDRHSNGKGRPKNSTSSRISIMTGVASSLKAGSFLLPPPHAAVGREG